MNKHGLYDIADAWHVPFWQTNVFYIVAAVLLLCIVSVLIVYVIKRYRARIVEIPLDQKIVKELLGFKDRGLIDASKGKEFYLALTAIMKNYLLGRFGIDCHGKTDAELVEHLKTVGFDEQAFDELQAIFSGMTVIKFANTQGAQEQIEQDWHRSISFVQKTAQRIS